MTSRYENLIKRLINADFNIINFHFPVSICITCKLTLNEHEKKFLTAVVRNYQL